MQTSDSNSDRQLILGAAAALKRLRPGYGPLIDFHGAIFLAQEQSARQVTLPEIRVESRVPAEKLAAGIPLVGLAAIPWDPAAAGALMGELCRVVLRDNPGLAADAEALLKAVEEGRLFPAALCAALLREEDPYFSQCAEELAIDKGFLAFMAYHSLRPSLEAAAITLAPLVEAVKGWERGSCPICGSGPAIALLRDEGKRLLVCSLCAHQWPARRLVCPFCEESDPRRLRYAFSDEEPEYRTELCDGCRTYLKTFDLRKIARPIYLPLEQVASLHLDVQAIQDGYRSRGIGLALPLAGVSCTPDAS